MGSSVFSRPCAVVARVGLDGVHRACAAAGRVARAAVCTALLTAPGAAFAKTPGGVHCYGKTCHRVSTLEEMDSIVGRTGFLKVSFYDHCRTDRFTACGLTSSGAVFRPDLTDNAASPIFPDGTVLLVFNPENKRAAVLRVNSAGPYWGDRKLDVSRAAADKLGFRTRGVADLMVSILKSPEPSEARYKKMRQYDSVPGYIGTFADFHAAHGAAIAALALEHEAVPMRVADSGASIPAQAPPVFPRPSKEELFKHATLFLDSIEPLTIDPKSPWVPLAPEIGLGADGSADGIASLPEVEVVQHPLDVIAAYEPDYSWEGLKQRFAVFVNDAIARARALEPPPVLPPREEWSEKLARFVSRARQQAREGIARRGPLNGLFAELRLKAQPPRRFVR